MIVWFDLSGLSLEFKLYFIGNFFYGSIILRCVINSIIPACKTDICHLLEEFVKNASKQNIAA